MIGGWGGSIERVVMLWEVLGGRTGAEGGSGGI